MQNQPTTTATTPTVELNLNRTCKNCQTEFHGNFCPACGQKYIDKRFNMRDSLSHLFGVVFNFDRGLWPTIIGLFKNPGKVIKDYLNGITIPYFHPFRFLFLLLSIQVFIMISTGMMEYVQQSFRGDEQLNPAQEEILKMTNVVNSYIHILIALSIPIVAFASYLFFKKTGYHYAEHLIISCYAYGQTVFMGILIMPLYYINVEAYLVAASLNLIIVMIYFMYVYLRLFEGRKWLIALKAIGVFIFTGIGSGIMTMIGMIIYLIIAYLRNPEFFEQFKNLSNQ